jgi:hypothetical protein
MTQKPNDSARGVTKLSKKKKGHTSLSKFKAMLIVFVNFQGVRMAA